MEPGVLIALYNTTVGGAMGGRASLMDEAGRGK